MIFQIHLTLIILLQISHSRALSPLKRLRSTYLNTSVTFTPERLLLVKFNFIVLINFIYTGDRNEKNQMCTHIIECNKYK